MRKLSESLIASLAPNPAAAENGRKISTKGGFVARQASADESFYLGECTGSGKSNYITTADFADPAQPVLRCSCPSRQFPCKHGIALLFEIAAGKTFAPCDIPEDILQKRTRREARAEKKPEAPAETAAEAAPPSPKPVNQAARAKKIKKQLEGLDFAEKMAVELADHGLGSIGGASLAHYRELARQLGDAYLPGPQLLIRRLLLEMTDYQEDHQDRHQRTAEDILVKLAALLRKARPYLEEKLANANLEDDDSVLYEELGGVWQLDRLRQLGLRRENARLLQLSFNVFLDRAREEFIDRGYWMDLDSGDIYTTLNYRPVKALKYVKEEDSCFDLLVTPELLLYPGGLNRRVRWAATEFRAPLPADFALLRDKAVPAIAPAVKRVKDQIKNPLEESFAAAAIRFRRIGRIGNDFVLEDATGDTLLLADPPGGEAIACRIAMLPDPGLLADQALFGILFYDEASGRIAMQPGSILTPNAVVRLQY